MHYQTHRLSSDGDCKVGAARSTARGQRSICGAHASQNCGRWRNMCTIVGISSVCIQRSSALTHASSSAPSLASRAAVRLTWQSRLWGAASSIEEVHKTFRDEVALLVRDKQFGHAASRPQSATKSMGPLVAARPTVASAQASSLVWDASGPPGCLPGSQPATVQTMTLRLPAATEMSPPNRATLPEIRTPLRCAATTSFM